MRRPVLCALFAIACCVSASLSAKASDRSANDLTVVPFADSRVTTAGSRPSAVFTPNRGQWPAFVLFRVDGLGATMWLERTGIVYEIASSVECDQNDGAGCDPAAAMGENRPVRLLTMEFLDANPDVTVEGEEELAYRSNFFLGADRTAWRTDVPNFSRVVYRGIYPGIDLELAGAPGAPEVRLVGAGNALGAESSLRVRFTGASGFTLGNRGEIRAGSESGAVVALLGPAVELVVQADGSYTLGRASTRATAENGAGAAGLSYSSLLGGGLDDRARSIKVDAAGNAFVVGYTGSTNFPTKTPYQSDQASSDAFVLKLGPGGGSLVYATYLGGGSGDVAVGVAINAAGQAYVSGTTSSTDFPTLTPYQATNHGAEDAFVAKLSAAGNSLLYATYVGGSGIDNSNAIAVDDSGRAYVVGMTASTDFPTLGPYQTDQGGNDAFVFKLSAAGSALVYSTYLGGSAADAGLAIALNAAGNAFVTGTTGSTNFPTQGPYQTDKLLDDAFVVKLVTAGNALVYATYLGGSAADEGTGIAVDASGNAYVSGSTQSVDFPIKNAYQTYQGDIGLYDAFVVKLTAAGNALAYATYLAGTRDDRAAAIAIDDSGSAYVAGSTWSTDFPEVNADGVNRDTTDAFVAKLSSTGSVLVYSSYLGGTYVDQALAVTANDSGSCWVAGYTRSPDFPMQNSYQDYLAGQEVFVAKVFTGACPITMTGDINLSGTVTSADIIQLVNYVFKGGVHPKPCDAAADVNCSGSVSSADIIYLVNHVFKGAAAPCDACGSPLAGGC